MGMIGMKDGKIELVMTDRDVIDIAREYCGDDFVKELETLIVPNDTISYCEEARQECMKVIEKINKVFGKLETLKAEIDRYDDRVQDAMEAGNGVDPQYTEQIFNKMKDFLYKDLDEISDSTDKIEYYCYDMTSWY